MVAQNHSEVGFVSGLLAISCVSELFFPRFIHGRKRRKRFIIFEDKRNEKWNLLEGEKGGGGRGNEEEELAGKGKLDRGIEGEKEERGK